LERAPLKREIWIYIGTEIAKKKKSNDLNVEM